MENICFMGDIHGEFNSYFSYLKKNNIQKSIQVGDYGLGFNHDPIITKKNEIYFSSNHRFIRGNHDNLEICKKYKNFIPDGTIEEISNGFMMFVGGAYSIDKCIRTPGKDWWYNEEISLEEAEKIFDIYIKTKPKIMVTHEVPRKISKNVFNLSEDRSYKNITNIFLQEMLEVHTPDIWIHGHWHQHYNKVIDGCNFIGLGINQTFFLDI